MNNVETSWEYAYEISEGSDSWVRQRVELSCSLERVLKHITNECRDHPEKLKRYRIIETTVTVHTPRIEVVI